jgi:hypothetical protein
VRSTLRIRGRGYYRRAEAGVLHHHGWVEGQTKQQLALGHRAVRARLIGQCEPPRHSVIAQQQR